jgi:hypothetical protein
MIVQLIIELTIVDIADRGLPNMERIVIRANSVVNLGQYGIMLGLRGAATSNAFPIRDNLLWLGDAVLLEGDWLFVYTGPGEPKITGLPNTNQRLISVHWGRPQTILNHEALVPILFRIDAVQVPLDRTLLPIERSGQTE